MGCIAKGDLRLLEKFKHNWCNVRAVCKVLFALVIVVQLSPNNCFPANYTFILLLFCSILPYVMLVGFSLCSLPTDLLVIKL